METKPIPGYSGYEISSDGSLITRCSCGGKRTRPVKTLMDRNGYRALSLYREDGKLVRRTVHHLVMLAWGPPAPDGCPMIRHLNDNKLDNRIENLCWGTARDNKIDRLRNHRDLWESGSLLANQKLTPNQVREIKALLSAGAGVRALGRQFGVDHTTIGAIKSGKSWGLLDEV